MVESVGPVTAADSVVMSGVVSVDSGTYNAKST